MIFFSFALDSSLKLVKSVFDLIFANRCMSFRRSWYQYLLMQSGTRNSLPLGPDAPGGPLWSQVAPASCLCWDPFSNNGWTSFAHRGLYQFVPKNASNDNKGNRRCSCNLYALKGNKENHRKPIQKMRLLNVAKHQ